MLFWWLVVPVANGTNGEQPPSKEENKLSKSSMSLERLDGGCFKVAMSDFIPRTSAFRCSISFVHLQSVDSKQEM